MRIAQRFNAGLSYLSPALNAPQPPKICVHPCESVVLVIRGSFVNSCLMAFSRNSTHLALLATQPVQIPDVTAR
jgi:hypothetical protein